MDCLSTFIGIKYSIMIRMHVHFLALCVDMKALTFIFLIWIFFFIWVLWEAYKSHKIEGSVRFKMYTLKSLKSY